MRHVYLAIAIVGLACSSNGRREDPTAMTASGSSTTPVTTAPKVHLATPSGEVAVEVEVVDTWPKIEKGLMYREHLGLENGMLFLMDHEEDWGFYMRNTLIPLDMIFIAKDFTIAGIVENAVPRDETSRRVGKPSLYVLEVNGGWTRKHGVVAGAKVRFENVKLRSPGSQ